MASGGPEALISVMSCLSLGEPHHHILDNIQDREMHMNMFIRIFFIRKNPDELFTISYGILCICKCLGCAKAISNGWKVFT